MTIADFNKLTKNFPKDTVIFFNLKPLNDENFVAKSIDYGELVVAEDGEEILLLGSSIVGDMHSIN